MSQDYESVPPPQNPFVRLGKFIVYGTIELGLAITLPQHFADPVVETAAPRLTCPPPDDLPSNRELRDLRSDRLCQRAIANWRRGMKDEL